MKTAFFASLALFAAAVFVVFPTPARADFLVVSSSFDLVEQKDRLADFSETLSPYGEVGLHRASNGAATVAVSCKDKADAQNLKNLLVSRKLAPADSYVMSEDKLSSMDTTATHRVFIQAAARRDRVEAVDFARQLYWNEHWNGEVQVWASDADGNGSRWFRVVIPGTSPEKAEALQAFLKSEHVIDNKAFITESSRLGLQIFSTADDA